MFYVRKTVRTGESVLKFAYLDKQGLWQEWAHPQVQGFKLEQNAFMFARGYGVEPSCWHGDIDDAKYEAGKEMIEVLALIPPRSS